MTRRFVAVLALAAAVAAAGCGSSSPSSPSSPDQSNVPYSQTDLVVGTGATAFSNSTIHATYQLWLYSETAADHKGTFIQSGTSVQFNVAETIAGWKQGIAGMKVGGVRRLILPPSLAYGSQGSSPSIPPNAALVYDVELVSIP